MWFSLPGRLLSKAHGLVWTGVPGVQLWGAIPASPTATLARLLPSMVWQPPHHVPRGLGQQYFGVQMDWAQQCSGQERVCNYRALQGGAWHPRSRVLSQE